MLTSYNLFGFPVVNVEVDKIIRIIFSSEKPTIPYIHEIQS